MSLPYLINKSKGIATTKSSNKPHEEEFSTSSTNPITFKDIWYDLDLIPSIAPTLPTPSTDTTITTFGVVKYYDNHVMTFVGDVNSSNTFKLVDEITGENLLQSAIYGINGSNKSYTIVVKNSLNEIIPNNTYDLDVGSGFLTFNKLPSGVSNLLPPKISFYKYVGFKGIPTAPIVVNPTLSLSGSSAVYQQTISEPGLAVYYYSLSNVNKTEYRSGYLNINYNNRIATFTDNYIDKNGIYKDSPAYIIANDNTRFVTFDVKVINSILYVYMNVSNLDPNAYLWNLILSNSTLLDGEKSQLNNVSTAITPINIKSFDLTTSIADPNIRGIILYYTIAEINNENSGNSGNNVNSGNVRSGILKYAYNDTLNDLIVEETIFPLLNDNSLSTLNNVTFDNSITTVLTSTKLNVFLNLVGGTIPLTNKKYKITTYEIPFNGGSIPGNTKVNYNLIGGSPFKIDSILINSTNYVNYKYILQDDYTVPGINDKQVTTFGELHVIWDNLNTTSVLPPLPIPSQKYNIFANNNGSSGIGIIGENPISPLSISDIIGNTPLITFSVSINGVDPNIIDIFITLDNSITTDPSPDRVYTMYSIKQSPQPLILAPLNPPFINQINNIYSPISPLMTTRNLLTLSNLSNGSIITYTITNSNGTARRTEEIKTVYNNKQPSIDFISSNRLIAPDLGDLSGITVKVINTGNNIITFCVDVSKDEWNLTYQIIDMMFNNSISKVVTDGALLPTTLDLIPLSDRGCSYYYLIKSDDNLHLQLGDLFISYGPTTTTSIFDSTVKILNTIYTSDVITYDNIINTSDPIGSIGNTSGVTFDITYGGSSFVSLVASNLAGPITQDVTIYLYKMENSSNNLKLRLDDVSSIEKSPFNLLTTNSIFTGKNVEINLPANSITNVFQFDLGNTIIPMFSTLPNPNRNPEQITTYILHYMLYGSGAAINSFRTGELYLHWLGSTLVVNDRYSFNPFRGLGIIPDLSDSEVVFSTSAFGNTYMLNANVLNNNYKIKLFTTLVLSNIKVPKVSLLNIVPGPLVSLLGNTIIRTYKADTSSGVFIKYILTSSGITPIRKRIGTLQLLWDSTIPLQPTNVIISDNYNISNTNFEIGDTSGITFIADNSGNNTIRLMVSVAAFPFPQIWEVLFYED